MAVSICTAMCGVAQSKTLPRHRPHISALWLSASAQHIWRPYNLAVRTMAFLAGARLGPYEIVSLIGAGGMGEVYKARDTRLNRIVAIKILPSHNRADPDWRRRLEREAQAAAMLARR